MKKFILLIAMAAIVALPFSAFAELIIYENFEATEGNENGVAFGSADASGEWSNGGTVSESPNTSSGDLPSAGTGLMPSSGNGKISINNPTDIDDGTIRPKTSWTSVEAGSYYASFLLNVTNVAGLNTAWAIGDDIFSLRDTVGSNVLGLRNDEVGGYEIVVAATKFDMANGPTDPQCSDAVSMSVNTVYLIVLGADDVTDSTAGSFKLWVNPVINGTAPAATTAGTWRTSGGANNDLLWFANNANDAGSADLRNVYIDEFRAGTNWTDVTPVPEPALLGLLGLGVLAFIRRK